MKKIFLLLLTAFIFSCYNASAQGEGTDEALASEYFQKGEFDKAAMLYKKLLDKQPDNNYYYDGYLSSLLKQKDYSTAEKELKKISKRNRGKVIYQVDLGYVYKLEGDEKKSKETFSEIIDELTPNPEQINVAAAAFQRREQPEYAIQTYLKARKLLNDPGAYSEELASLYKDAAAWEPMFAEYIRIIDENPFSLETAQEQLQDVVMKDEPYDIFRKMLLKKIQAQPDNTVYSDMLTWLFVQRKDFNAAFVQSKSLDKRLKEGGRRLIELARIVTMHGDYDLAEKIYQSVIDQGDNASYYIPAKRGILDIKYEKVTQTSNYTDEDINMLVQSYNDFINSYGMLRPESGDVVLRLAEVQALYAHKVKPAIDLLSQYEKIPGIDNIHLAKAKLALGDYSLLTGEGWESTLYYGQVEKMFKDNPLGHEAKFRNAKLSFHRGEFEWAKAQLDVLKSSTSELIANDAMQLSLLIQDNIGLDTTEKPLKLYAEADFLIYKNQFADAQKKLDSINTLYPGHSLSDEILMARASMAFKQRNYEQAFNFYNEVYTQYGKDILGDDALYQAARIQDRYLNNPEKAKELYEKLFMEYQGSVYAVEARNRYRILRGDVIN